MTPSNRGLGPSADRAPEMASAWSGRLTAAAHLTGLGNIMRIIRTNQ
jgi:hypothetical protein